MNCSTGTTVMSAPPERILLANDDLFFSARILSVLTNLGYQADRASTQEQALQKAAADRPALVILNLAAPRLGGLELARRLKAEAGAPRVLAFLSHVNIPDVREEALAAGVDRIVANSAISLRLPDIVREVLGSSREQAVEDR